MAYGKLVNAMVDLYLKIADQPDQILDAIASSMNTRAAEPAMQKICSGYMTPLSKHAGKVLEIGCGNGASTRLLMNNLKPDQLVGIDPSSGLVERARDAFKDDGDVTFALGDAIDTGQPDNSFDVVVAHTVFSHLPDPVSALSEVYRVLKPGGIIAVFDGDYATNTVALFDGDPLQAAMQATQRNLIHDPYIMRSLPQLAKDTGFIDGDTEAYGYIQTRKPDYLLSLLSRGVDAANSAGEIGGSLTAGFKSEAARRVEKNCFYGAILFVCFKAAKPTI